MTKTSSETLHTVTLRLTDAQRAWLADADFGHIVRYASRGVATMRGPATAAALLEQLKHVRRPRNRACHALADKLRAAMTITRADHWTLGDYEVFDEKGIPIARLVLRSSEWGEWICARPAVSWALAGSEHIDSGISVDPGRMSQAIWEALERAMPEGFTVRAREI